MADHLIRKADVSDIPRLKEIRFSVKENQLLNPERVTNADYLWFVENGPIWVWEQNFIVLGFSAGDSRDGSIWAMFVHPDAENRGIGKTLLDYCCQSLSEAGYQTLTLNTEPHTRAAGFYKSRGWIEQEKK